MDPLVGAGRGQLEDIVHCRPGDSSGVPCRGWGSRGREPARKENRPAVAGPIAAVGRGWASHGMQASVGPTF